MRICQPSLLGWFGLIFPLSALTLAGLTTSGEREKAQSLGDSPYTSARIINNRYGHG